MATLDILELGTMENKNVNATKNEIPQNTILQIPGDMGKDSPVQKRTALLLSLQAEFQVRSMVLSPRVWAFISLVAILFTFSLVAANCCTADVRRLGGMKGSAALVAFLKLRKMPRLISFSGGRSSAMMLKILADNGLQDDDFVLFANTGKERPETLDFVHECETRWQIPVVWIEATFRAYDLEIETMVESIGFRVVNYETASRDGRPFSEMISWVNCGHVPNRVTRFCTKYLKVIPMKRYLESIGADDFDTVMGIRFDEPARYRKYKGDGTFPLVDMQVTEANVFRFWSAQPFDLKLKQYEGNCDLCHLKSLKKLKTIIAEQGEGMAAWWIEQERKTNSTFLHGMDFSILTEIATNRRFSKAIDTRSLIEHDLFSVSCFCGD